MLHDQQILGGIWGAFRHATDMDIPLFSTMGSNREKLPDDGPLSLAVLVMYNIKDVVDGYRRNFYLVGRWFAREGIFQFEIRETSLDLLRPIQAEEFGLLAMTSYGKRDPVCLSDEYLWIFDGPPDKGISG